MYTPELIYDHSRTGSFFIQGMLNCSRIYIFPIELTDLELLRNSTPI